MSKKYSDDDVWKEQKEPILIPSGSRINGEFSEKMGKIYKEVKEELVDNKSKNIKIV